MSAIPIIRKQKPDEAVELLRELVAEIKGLRADLRKRDAVPDAAELVAALWEHFGKGPFTAGGLLMLADGEPHGAVACALAGHVDLYAPTRARATQLGVLLRRLPQLQCVGRRAGAALYGVNLAAEVPEVHESRT
jgi:hypothetical protein